MSLSDYSSLENRIKDAPEPKILDAGTEVKGRIILVNTGVSEKNDAKWYSVLYDVPSEALCPPFSDFFWELADKEKIDPKQFAQAIRSFKVFAEAFDIDYSRPFSWEDDLPGKEGWMIVGVKKDKSGEYPDQNKVSKYISPK